MKKGIIFTTALAMVLGVGVAVGAHQAAPKAVSAEKETTTLYLCTNKLAWYGDQARAYLYGDSGDNTWPGQELTLVDGETNIYKLDVDNMSDFHSAIFLRSNGSDVWNRTSKFGGVDISLPTDWSKENMFTFNESWDGKIEYDDGNYTGSWSLYGEPAEDPIYTVKYNNFTTVEFELDEDEKPEGVLHQYSAEINGVSRGRELKFYKDDVQITAKIGVDGGNNNVYGNVTDGFRIYSPNNYGKTKIYLKTYSDGGYSIWGEGYKTYSFIANIMPSAGAVTQEYELTLDETFGPNETYIEQYKTSGKVVMNALKGDAWNSSFDLQCEGANEYVTPENVPNNNARQAFQSTAWKVHNDCEEVIYVKIKRADLSAWIFVDGYEAAHVLTIGGQEINLTKANETEYAAHGVNLAAGAEVTSYTIEGVEQTATAKADKTNNLASNMKVITANASADIYFDTETSTLWISGLEALANGFHLYVNTTIRVLKSRVNEYYSTLISFAANDEIRFIHIQDDAAPVIFGNAAVEGGPQSSHFEFVTAKGCIVAKDACDSALYFKPGETNNVWFDTATQDLKDAKEFADAFNKALALVCKADGTTDKEALASAWLAKKATFTDDLSEEAQNILKAATKDHAVEEIANFIAKYELIATRYGNFLATKDAKWNFLGKSITSVGAIELNNNSIESSSLIVIVSIIAVTSISAVGILLVIKKRRHN